MVSQSFLRHGKIIYRRWRGILFWDLPPSFVVVLPPSVERVDVLHQFVADAFFLNKDLYSKLERSVRREWSSRNEIRILRGSYFWSNIRHFLFRVTCYNYRQTFSFADKKDRKQPKQPQKLMTMQDIVSIFNILFKFLKNLEKLYVNLPINICLLRKLHMLFYGPLGNRIYTSMSLNYKNKKEERKFRGFRLWFLTKPNIYSLIV